MAMKVNILNPHIGKLIFTLLMCVLTTTNYAADSSLRGIVQAKQRSILSALVAGQITQLPLQAGQTFKQGDLLMALDCRHYQAAHKGANAEWRAKQKTFTNNQSLQQYNAIGKLEVELARSERDVAESKATQAKVTVEGCKIKAPYAGTVVKTFTQLYQTINVGDPVIEIIDNKNLSVEMILPYQHYFATHPGDKINFIIDGQPNSTPLKITRLAPVIDTVSNTFRAYADFTNLSPSQPVSPGMTGIIILNNKPSTTTSQLQP
ncbi:efflux RND transporter periplasmic adaptor subunit [Zooshikella sp. RANM57]